MADISAVIEKIPELKAAIEQTPTVQGVMNDLQILRIGTAAIANICVLDLAEYRGLSKHRADTLYLIRG